MHRYRDLELGPQANTAPLSRLTSWTEAPEHDKDNPYILSGYRAREQHSSIRACGWSLFQLHNETANIWTHLVALLGALPLHGRISLSADLLLHPQAQWATAAAITSFCVAAECCFGFSVLYHTFKCHSGRSYLRLLLLDQLGIILLIVSSFLPGLQLAFYCKPNIAAIYCVIIGAALLVGITLIWMQAQHPERQDLQPIIQNFFVGTVVFGLLPASHFVVDALGKPEAQFVNYLAGMFGAFGVGFVFYAAKIPEKLAPGRFDLLFASHQLWHVFVALGALCWYYGLSNFLRFRLEHSCPANIMS